MKFVRKNINDKQYIDSVFLVSSQAKKDIDRIDATNHSVKRYNDIFQSVDVVYHSSCL